MARNKEITSRRVSGWLYVLEWDDTDECYIIVDCDADDWPYESQACMSSDEEGARNEFSSYCDAMEDPDYAPAPDWEAQARYDELHGTVNGEDPRIVEMRELWGC
jgi:hypothetical protein